MATNGFFKQKVCAHAVRRSVSRGFLETELPEFGRRCLGLLLLCAASEMGLCVPILLKLCGAMGKVLSRLPGVAVMAMALPFDQTLISPQSAAWRSGGTRFCQKHRVGSHKFRSVDAGAVVYRLYDKVSGGSRGTRRVGGTSCLVDEACKQQLQYVRAPQRVPVYRGIISRVPYGCVFRLRCFVFRRTSVTYRERHLTTVLVCISF